MLRPKVVIADPDPVIRAHFRQVCAALGVDALETEAGDRLETILEHDENLDLVITASQLPSRSGLQVLARARARGNQTPFILISSIHPNALRIMISDTEGSVLSTRVVDTQNFVALAADLIDRSVRSSRRAKA